jgi:hypothetical protein
MKRLRLAWNVIEISPERQASKLAAAAARRTQQPV